MKKLVLIFFIAGFVGLAFAYSPAKVYTSKEQTKISMLDDTTKTTKKTTTTKENCTNKSCCKKKCTNSTNKSDKPTK